MPAPVPVSNFERATALSCVITENDFGAPCCVVFVGLINYTALPLKCAHGRFMGFWWRFSRWCAALSASNGTYTPEHRAKFSTRHTGNSICPRVYVYLYIPPYRGIKVNITSPRGYWENRNIKVLMSMSWAVGHPHDRNPLLPTSYSQAYGRGIGLAWASRKNFHMKNAAPGKSPMRCARQFLFNLLF